jgi:hypothetical protein
MDRDSNLIAGLNRRGITPDSISWLLIGCLTVFVCGACTGIVVLSATLIYGRETLAEVNHTPSALAQAPLAEIPLNNPTVAPAVISEPTVSIEVQSFATPVTVPTATPKTDLLLDLNPPSDIEQTVLEGNEDANLMALLEANYPARDYYENAYRLSSEDVGSRVVNSGPYNLGDFKRFSTEDGSVEAELLAITEHVYFWAESSLRLNKSDVEAAALRFEAQYYDSIVKLFGEEWRPGIDGDPHFSVMHLDGFSDDGELGFFDSGDEYPKSINSSSNEQEIIYLNMENLRIGEELYFGTLVHEVQHLIHWNLDANEAAWLDEGLAQLTETYVGLDTVDTEPDYLADTGIQLNIWEYEDEDLLYAHYGASYLFVLYLWEQFGEQAIIELARHPANGMAAVFAILRDFRPDLTLSDLIGDWAVANYLDDTSGNTKFGYQNTRLSRPSHAIEVKQPPFNTVSEIEQNSVHYARLNLSGKTTISFAGDSVIELTDSPPHSGQLMFYSPGIDEVDAQLTRAFDLTNLNSATLNFWTWYDLERDFDYGYISISTDGGVSWRLLVPDNAQGGEFGPGFTGRSQDKRNNIKGWIQESISLNNFVGQPVLIRFEVLTDSAIADGGFAIDDIEIPELGYITDLEASDGGWQADGFVRLGWRVPQMWSVRYIQNGSAPQVYPLELNDQNLGQWTLGASSQGGVLVIVATTPFVTEPASYWLSLE